MGREVASLTIEATPATLDRLTPVLADVLAAARCHTHTLNPNPSLEESTITIKNPTFPPRTQ